MSPRPRNCSARESHEFLTSGRNELRTPATFHRACISDLKTLHLASAGADRCKQREQGAELQGA